MSFKYSPSTRGFYREDFHGDAIPSDAVELSDAQYAEMSAAAHDVVQLVPASVSMRQARLALLAIGKLDDVASAIAAKSSPDRERAQIEWEYATRVERSSALLADLSALLGLDLDALFIEAAAL